MSNWLRSLLRKPPADVQELQREVQSLRLELQEREQSIAALKQELERQRSGASARVSESVQAQVEQLLAAAATPAAQLLTQAYLADAGQAVQAKDVLAVARRLVRALEDGGLKPEGSIGETVAFNPDAHEPLGAAWSPRAGQPAVVRFVGMSYGGRLLRKAGVEKAEG